VCAVRMDRVDYTLLFIYVNGHCEVDDNSNIEYADQLLAIEDLCNNNSDWHIIASGDYNGDYSSDRRHTVLLNYFREFEPCHPTA